MPGLAIWLRAFCIPPLLVGAAVSGVSAQEVASGSVTWDLESGLRVRTAEAAKTLMPMMGKIRAFEKRKRDTMTAVAIRPDRGMDIIPDPQAVGRGGTSEVTIRSTSGSGDSRQPGL